MPSQNQRPPNAPDPSDSRERAQPAQQPGLGKMGPTDNTPHVQEDDPLHTRKQAEHHRERTADEVTDQSDAVHPADAMAHGGRASADEAEAIGKTKHNPGQPAPGREQGGR